jgi:soluble lytic murein transglycosylase-like protein
VYHFTNTPRPDAAPFIIDQPIARGSGHIQDEIVPPVYDAREYDKIIEETAKRHEVEAALVKAVIRAESGFNRLAVSRAGARGLMQLMPRTARRAGVRNVYDARDNIEGGIRHLRELLDRYDRNLPRVLAAYNAGTDAVDRYRGLPPYAETQSYVSRVLRFRQQYLKKQRMGDLAQRF